MLVQGDEGPPPEGLAVAEGVRAGGAAAVVDGELVDAPAVLAGVLVGDAKAEGDDDLTGEMCSGKFVIAKWNSRSIFQYSFIVIAHADAGYQIHMYDAR